MRIKHNYYTVANHNYCSVPGKRPLPGTKRPCTAFQGATVAASIQMRTHGILILGKRPCWPKSLVICLGALIPGTLRYYY